MRHVTLVLPQVSCDFRHKHISRLLHTHTYMYTYVFIQTHTGPPGLTPAEVRKEHASRFVNAMVGVCPLVFKFSPTVLQVSVCVCTCVRVCFRACVCVCV